MKASDYRKLQSKKPSQTADVKLPSGAVFTLRRPPLDVWTRAGKVPDFFVRMSLQAKDGSIDTTGEDMSADEVMSSLTIIREILLYSIVSPKLKVGATPDGDELDPAEIDGEDIDFLTSYILFKGCPDIPVETKGGQVSVQSLANFRQKRPGAYLLALILMEATPSKRLQLRDDVVSLAFDYWIAWERQKWRDEREAQKFEALAGVAPFAPQVLSEF